MAELPNRDELEIQFAKKFGRVARRHMHEFRELLGNPPDLANVPESFYDKMRQETERETFAILLLIWSDSAEYHGWTGYDMSLAAMGWSATRSQDLGKYWSDSTRDRVEKGFDKLLNPMRRHGTSGTVVTGETTIDEARETNATIPGELRRQGQQRPTRPTEPTAPSEPPGRVAPYEPEETPEHEEEFEPYERPNISREELDHLLDVTFGPKRVEKIAVNETTSARGAGGEAAVHANGDESDDDLWMNPDDKLTCIHCHPLVFTKRPEWSRVAPDGPPPPDSECWCRCWIKYAKTPAAKKSLIGPFCTAWHRKLPNAAEWRAWCCENGVDCNDRRAFKSYDPNCHQSLGDGCRDDWGE